MRVSVYVCVSIICVGCVGACVLGQTERYVPLELLLGHRPRSGELEGRRDAHGPPTPQRQRTDGVCAAAGLARYAYGGYTSSWLGNT